MITNSSNLILCKVICDYMCVMGHTSVLDYVVCILHQVYVFSKIMYTDCWEVSE